ncbi:hypothetical protein CRM22_007126, partial [Opisthorchis felineus]
GYSSFNQSNESLLIQIIMRFSILGRFLLFSSILSYNLCSSKIWLQLFGSAQEKLTFEPISTKYQNNLISFCGKIFTQNLTDNIGQVPLGTICYNGTEYILKDDVPKRIEQVKPTPADNQKNEYLLNYAVEYEFLINGKLYHANRTTSSVDIW